MARPLKFKTQEELTEKVEETSSSKDFKLVLKPKDERFTWAEVYTEDVDDDGSIDYVWLKCDLKKLKNIIRGLELGSLIGGALVLKELAQLFGYI